MPNSLNRLFAHIRGSFPDELRFHLPRIIIDYNADYAKSVFLAGTGRSGTTWVSNILNYDNRYRDMFEPFHGHYVAPHSSRFVYHLYLRPDNRQGNYLRPARRILTGQIMHRWIDQANHKWLVNRRLIKEIRANLWLKWLKVNFPKLPIILLFRHPCAVAESRMSLEWPTRLQQFLVQDELMEDHLEKFRDIMSNARTPFERHIIVWCIQHYVPLCQFRPGDIYIAFYENLLVDPEREVSQIFSFLGQEFDGQVFSQLRKPSFTTRADSAARDRKRTASALAESWKTRISKEDLRRAIEILKQFGLQRIYNEDPMPNADGANSVMLDLKRS